MATKLTIVLCFCSVAIAQQNTDNNYFSADLSADLDTAVQGVRAGSIYNARLDHNGVVAGRLQMKYPTGKTAPAAARIDFTQSGQLIRSALTDSTGQFKTAGLAPGAYMARVAVGSDSAEIPVNVLEFDPVATTDIIEGTLTPLPQGDLHVSSGCDCGSAVESAPAAPMAPLETPLLAEGCTDCGQPLVAEGCSSGCDQPLVAEGCSSGCSAPVQEVVVGDAYAPVAGFSSGCSSCGGGFGGGGLRGGRIGGLLGAAGLAGGITALAIDDEDAVSPAAP